MNYDWKYFFKIRLGLSCLLLLVLGSISATAQECSQSHANRQHRIESVAKRGDSRMTLSISGHVTAYAIQRYNLSTLVTQADIDRTSETEMYNFLKWKFGSPTAVMPEFVANGYQHFDRGYVDEAAAILLGVISFKKVEPEIVIPRWMMNWIRSTLQGGSLTQAAIVTLFTEIGVSPELSNSLAILVAKELGKQVPDEVRLFIPKKYDVDNRLVDAAIKAKKYRPPMPSIELPIKIPIKIPG